MSSLLEIIIRVHSKRGTIIKMLELGLFPWVGVIFLGAAINEVTGFEIAKTEGGFIAISLILEVILLYLYIFVFTTKYKDYSSKNKVEVQSLRIIQKLGLALKLNLKNVILASIVILISLVLTLFYELALTYIGLIMVLNIPIFIILYGDVEYINVRIID